MSFALKLLLRLLLALTGLVLAYFVVAYGLVFFSAQAGQTNVPAVVTAYVYSNGVHTDLVFPVHTQGVDWSLAFPAQHFAEPPRDATFVAIGWGEREFYLNTPRWQDLTVGRAWHALSGSGRSLLHVTYLRPADMQASGFYALPLSAQQYTALVQHVNTSLVRADNGQGVNVPGQHYTAQDAFYEATGAYNLFTTCNAWTGRGLAQAGVKVSAWTPLASQVVWHLPLR
ncbi:MAG: TIGR02117 family protein [Cytophagales bacterium]|nr:TIGR02117 family protein [Rhizobacter sp.]